MTAEIRLPRVLTHSVKAGLIQEVCGETVGELLEHLFESEPGLRPHLVDETGAIRPHVSIFVDGTQAKLETTVAAGAHIRVLHAVSGGALSARDV